MRQILTDAACNSKPPRTGRLEIADLRQTGLVLRITANGARSFAYRFRHPLTRKTLRLTIGSYPATSLGAARKRAREIAEQVEEGTNPIEARQAERESAPARTFQALSDRYLKEYAERHKRPRSTEEDRRNLNVHILPKWGKRDFRTIRRADIIELIESIISDGKHVAANRVHTLISGIFSFAIDSALLEANPAARLKKRGKEKPSDRILTDDEIRAFWNGIVLPPVSRAVGLSLRLALLTATRANEVAGARKIEFQDLNNPEQAKWIIPKERVKNNSDHLVPLSTLAVETINAAIDLTRADDEFLLPTRLERREGPIDRHTLSMAMARFGKELSGPKSWKKEMPSPHDLRRTANTRLAEMKIPKEVRDRILNHVGSRRRDPESKHYNLYEFEPEKREALTKWADEIASLTGPATVIPLSQRRR